MRTVCQDQREWSYKLMERVTTYKTRSHLTTGVTPFSLMFNRLPVMKMDRHYGLSPPPFDETVNRLGKSKKLNVKWKGPYRVMEACWPKVKLADQNAKEKSVHMNHVKPVKTDRPLDIFQGRGRLRKSAGRSNSR
ncbi:hypothetical protein TYRP_022083 [Tyrophagus putrescentiae]|nr:hypothetical protein TYRP_022083 [Tyrophagus putrescentiae]